MDWNAGDWEKLYKKSLWHVARVRILNQRLNLHDTKLQVIETDNGIKSVGHEWISHTDDWRFKNMQNQYWSTNRREEEMWVGLHTYRATAMTM
jgi:hypothetical protein